MEGVSATLNYMDPSSQRNRLYVAPGGHVRTAWYTPRTVRIRDGRPFRDDFGLDRSGFALLDHDSAVTDFSDPGELDGRYTGEATGLVREVTGADEVVPLGWVIRRAGEDKRGAQPPAPDVHVDVHPGRAHDRMTAAASKGRPFRRAIMTSLWRAFSPPPQDWPLAILDYRSVTDTEGVPNLLLFKLHDTDHSVAWRAPHTAFYDAGASGAHPRESVELRTVAFFY